MAEQAPPSPVRTHAAYFAELARTAFDRAVALQKAGQLAAAEAWFARAHRFAPDDLTAAFALGAMRLRQGRAAEAAVLLARVTEGSDAREAWLARVGAEIQAGRAGAAAESLHQALSRFVLPAEAGLPLLLERVCREAGWPGWCALDREGRLCLGGIGTARPDLLLDGHPVRASGGGGVFLLPRAAVRGTQLAVALAGKPLLGSPILLARLRRVEGCVAAQWEGQEGALVGWAWCPADPDQEPRLEVCDSHGRHLAAVVARDLSVTAPRPLARPRGFRLEGAVLAQIRARTRGGSGRLHVRGADGRDLAGSPLGLAPPGPVRPVGPRPPLASPAPARPRRGVAVVVPVYGGGDVTRACLESVLATLPRGARVVVVDDASPDPELRGWLEGLARRRRLVLLRRARNGGFVAAANAGLRAALALPGGRDVVLLNSDTSVTPGWLEGLRAAVQAAGDIATATALSNDASILSYPRPDGPTPTPAPEGAALARLARLAARANAGRTVEIPTAVGFCMYIRRECLQAVGLLREDVFAQGYGEENDFCLRARALGWRHVAVPGVYVAHRGGASFGGMRTALLARNLAVLEALHPGYHALVAAHVAADPLAPARRRLDEAILRAGPRQPAVLLVSHDSGGGVERVLKQRCVALAAGGRRVLVLRPVPDPEGSETLPGVAVLGEGVGHATPNLRFHLPEEFAQLVRLLRRLCVAAVEVHHLLGHDPVVMELPARLGVPCDVVLHDYAWICPRITLTGPDGRYCGEPDEVAACTACLAAGEAPPFAAGMGVAALRARSAAWLAAARTVRVPSADAARRLGRYFPGREIQVDSPGESPEGRPGRPVAGGRTRVAVVGGISPEKGFDVLLACARDAAARDLPLEFVLVGHAPDDAALLESGRVFVTGPYAPGAAVAEIRAQQTHFGFLPSVWPETWCFTLGELWAAGLEAVVFDIGAPAERVRRRGRGRVLPLGLPPSAINNALLAVRVTPGHEWPLATT